MLSHIFHDSIDFEEYIRKCKNSFVFYDDGWFFCFDSRTALTDVEVDEFEIDRLSDECAFRIFGDEFGDIENQLDEFRKQIELDW